MSAGNPYDYPSLSCVADLYDNDLTYVKSFQIGMGDFCDCDFTMGKHGCQDFLLSFSAYQNIQKTQIVNIRLSGTIFFTGVIREISENPDSNGKYVYAGYGLYNYLEKGNTTEKTFLSTTIYDMIEWFVDAIIAKGKPIVKNMAKVDAVLDTYLIDALAFQNESIDSALDTLRKIANGIDGNDYIFGVDEDRELFFTARSTAIQKTLSVGAEGENGIAEYRPTDAKEEPENIFSIGTNALYNAEDAASGSGDTDNVVYVPALSENNIDDFIEGEIYDFIRSGKEASITWKIEDSSPLQLIGDGIIRVISGNTADELPINEVEYSINSESKIRRIRLGGIEVPETETAAILFGMKRMERRIENTRAAATIINNNVLSMGTRQNYVFADSFDSENSLVSWTNYNGSGEITIENSASSVMGGNYAKIGNNAGNDQIWMIHNILIPFNPDVLYRIRVYASRTNGAGTVYLGVAGYDENKDFLNSVGGSTYSSQHYFAAAGQNPGAGTLYTGYFRGTNIPAGGEHTSVFSPGYMYTGVKYFSPLILANYNAQAGETNIFYFTIEILPDTELDLLGDFGAATATIAGLLTSDGADFLNGDLVNIGDITAIGLLTCVGADLGNGGIVDTGSIAGATTITANGLLTCVGATLSNGGLANVGALSGATTISASGLLTANGANLSNGGITNAGAMSGITGITASGNSIFYTNPGAPVLNDTRVLVVGGHVSAYLYDGASWIRKAVFNRTQVLISDGDIDSPVLGDKRIYATNNAYRTQEYNGAAWVSQFAAVNDTVTILGLLTSVGASLGNGGITNTGPIAGATTITASGLLTANGANLSSGGITNAGAIAGVTSLSATGDITSGGIFDGVKKTNISIRDSANWTEDDLFDELSPFVPTIGDSIILFGTADVDWNQIGLGESSSTITEVYRVDANTIRIYGAYSNAGLSDSTLETIDCVNGNGDFVMNDIDIRG